MRKKSHRKPRPVARLLTPKQHEQLILGPRMHLVLLCAGTGTREHAITVASALNIGVALAHLRQNAVLQKLFENAQKRLIESLTPSDPVVLPENVAEELQVAFHQLDSFIGIQHMDALVRAIEFVEQAIESGEGAQILSLPD